jgi:MFS transporter, putative metabolite:H+ symporter
MKQNQNIGIFSIPVFVAALGYFVDIYDLLLFSFIRIASLKSFGFTQDQSAHIGLSIISYQMAGLMIGGILWGVLGDKKGRMSVLFGSIIMYSLANIANGFVHDVTQYSICRFIAGIGLAGELGAGITLVCELIPKEKRGYATSFIAGIGLTGAILAYFISKEFDWRVCYFIGGGLGLLLLCLRVSVFESGMFEMEKKEKIQHGNFFMFFNNYDRFKRYMLGIMLGLPIWYILGILVQLSDKFGKQFGIKEDIAPGKVMVFMYVAISIADFLSGILSQVLKSRKKALYIYYAIMITGVVLYFFQYNGSANGMIVICMIIGFGTGFWALFVTIAAEQFGTNLRATATTTTPNMVRGSLVVIAFLFEYLQRHTSFIISGAITGAIVMVIGCFALVVLKETYGKDLNFLEH